ncbi:hypothetical protein CCACVL1_04833 [Corchorus capsularis]|uniref:Uncharacterized protein n=1 Tax=Corchorus capsularis TaxID=210143 RepID=A0A1R3JPD9_COCAP|nr:hypothetical protein CCACVL1_04833 [Corchorus capsularis]
MIVRPLLSPPPHATWLSDRRVTTRLFKSSVEVRKEMCGGARSES